ncbi:hypothetical protein BH11ACT6_BH11ACT6_19170 [soil metagenome]
MMGFMADDELHQLYQAPPQEFTALRTELAAAAKKRGDTAAAKSLSAARKPTTAAWVVNRLVHVDTHARDRLRDLADQLRAAHNEMDGDRIRALSAEQRLLVDHLGKSAVGAAELTNPSAALRDDVTATLQAAIADPEVAARLGVLVKAERWSGFGFGESTMVSGASREPAAKSPAKTPEKSTPTTKPAAAKKPAEDTAADRRHAARKRELQSARAAMAEARRAKSASDETQVHRHKELAAAKTRHQEAQRALRHAADELEHAQTAYTDAERAGVEAAEAIETQRARLDELRG